MQLEKQCTKGFELQEEYVEEHMQFLHLGHSFIGPTKKISPPHLNSHIVFTKKKHLK